MVTVVMMMVVMVTGLLDEKAGAGQAAADGFLRFEDHFFRELEGPDGLLKNGEGHAQIKQGGAEHVATDAGRAVEMEVSRLHLERISKNGWESRSVRRSWIKSNKPQAGLKSFLKADPHPICQSNYM